MIQLLIAFLLATPLAAMEPVPMKMLDESQKETTPLLAPSPIAMKDQDNTDESKSVLFNGSRRYYDNESYKRVRNEAIKQCLCYTLCSGIVFGGLGCVCTEPCVGCLSACAGTTKGSCFCYTTGGIFVETGIVCGVPSGCLGSVCLGCIATCGTQKNLEDSLEKLEWNDNLEISSDMLAAADPKKLIWLEKEPIVDLLMHAYMKTIKDDCALPFLRKLFACSYYEEKKIRNAITKRLQYNRIRTVLAHKFQKKYHLPRDLRELLFRKYLFKSPKFKEIDQQSYVTEKELFYLLRDLNRTRYWKPIPQVAHAYAKQLLLAQNGWISLTKSEQYPIRCEMKYFNSNTLPENAKLWYSPSQGPTIYLPYSPQLALFYKFENDPAYAVEHEAPSSKKIGHLLQLRQEILGCNSALPQPIPNNKNIN